jgi:hypothetical protein
MNPQPSPPTLTNILVPLALAALAGAILAGTLSLGQKKR